MNNRILELGIKHESTSDYMFSNEHLIAYNELISLKNNESISLEALLSLDSILKDIKSFLKWVYRQINRIFLFIKMVYREVKVTITNLSSRINIKKDLPYGLYTIANYTTNSIYDKAPILISMGSNIKDNIEYILNNIYLIVSNSLNNVLFMLKDLNVSDLKLEKFNNVDINYCNNENYVIIEGLNTIYRPIIVKEYNYEDIINNNILKKKDLMSYLNKLNKLYVDITKVEAIYLDIMSVVNKHMGNTEITSNKDMINIIKLTGCDVPLGYIYTYNRLITEIGWCLKSMIINTPINSAEFSRLFKLK